ncbi:C-X-C motif chemokine 13 [Cynocephalus volans]|uniref:C-X-C motif chemokine 13 n=1 Tax=Cynocephalus volans TaxID=110931 RepID=UPI002FC728AB
MRLTTASLLLLLLVSSLSPVHGILEAYNTNLKCKCIRSASYFPLRSIDKIQIVSPGNGCPKKEILLWRKNKLVACVNPEAKWIQKAVELFQK